MALRVLGLAFLVFLPASSHGADEPEQILARLEQQAMHQPVQALHDLDAYLLQKPDLDEHALLRVEVVRILVADAQYRAEDVLKLSDAIRDRLLRIADARLQVKVARARGGAFFDLGRFESAWMAFQEEVAQARSTKDDDLIALALADHAYYLIRRSDFEQAAATIADADRHVRGPQASADVAYDNAMLLQEIGEWPLALTYYQTAQRKYNEIGDLPGQADSLSGIGSTLYRLGRLSEATEPLAAAAHTYEEIGDEDGGALVTGYQALVYAGLNEPEFALRLSTRTLETLGHMNKPVRLARARIERAGLLVKLQRAGEALPLIEQARPVLLDQENLNLRTTLYQTTAAALAAVGSYRGAYEQMTQAQEAERRQTEQLVARQLAAQRGRLESERLSRENSLLRAQTASGESALAQARRANQLEGVALALGAFVVVGTLVAIRRQRALTRQIARIAETDALTGMLNRRHVLDLGQRMMNRCRRDGQPCAMLMLDVDRFKDINDRYGHLAGDRALRAIGKALNGCLRPGDQIGRYGGEEFAVILPGADAREAGVVAERLRSAVALLPPDWAPGAESLTVSGGIAIATAEVADFTDLLVRADKALYRAKGAGRNRMELHGSEPAMAAA